MGMDTHVSAYFEESDEFIAKRDAFNACIAAGIDPPEGLNEMFEDGGEQGSDVPGPEFDLHEWSDHPHPSVSGYKGNCREGYQIDLRKLPDGIRWIRVYNSW